MYIVKKKSIETVFPGHNSTVEFIDGTKERDYLIFYL
jgi:hypothetical protein